MLFSLGQRASFIAILGRLEDSERLQALLDDIFVVSTPMRTVAIHDVLREESWRHVKISTHHGKTRIWNCGVFDPDRCDELEEATRAVDPTPGPDSGGPVTKTNRGITETPSWTPQ